MRLGTKTRYGTRAMLDPSLRCERGFVSVREMAGGRFPSALNTSCPRFAPLASREVLVRHRAGMQSQINLR